MKLSVCMIVKDEEKTIARILKCAKKISDEIIIVDTGSNDKTKQIAKKFTNKIYDFAWIDDFAVARNFSFSKATGTHIMWLDADDYIDDKNIKKIIQLKQKDDDFDFCMCKYKLNQNFEYYRERIIKNSPNFVWQGFIHEAIAPCGKIIYSDITIEHIKQKQSNPKRNLKIYKKHLKNGEIFDARATYYFAKEFFYNGYYHSAIIWLKKFLKFENKFAPNVLDAYLTISKCYFYKKQYKKSINNLLYFLKNNQPNAEMCCLLAKCFLMQNLQKNAVFWYKTALNCNYDIKSGEFCDNSFCTITPALELCVLHYNLGDFEKAKQYHMLAKSFCPNHPSVVYNKKFFE